MRKHERKVIERGGSGWREEEGNGRESGEEIVGLPGASEKKRRGGRL